MDEVRASDGSIHQLAACQILSVAQGVDYAPMSAAEDDNQAEISINDQCEVIS